MDKLCSLNQDLLSTLKNTLVAQKMEAWLDNFAQRWDNLVQKLEKSSAQVSDNQFSSVTQSCPTLCDPMNRSTPGLPVHHQLPEFTQTHVQ